MNVGSLFSGIGGIELGLERAGHRTLWQVESDDFCRRVLARHWPDVPRYGDVRSVDPRRLARPEIVCGGFPCQDLSPVGRRAGLAGVKSGLWSEFARIVRHLRPDYVLVENVPGLLVRGLDRVLGDLADVGYDAEWDCLPARAFGAPHLRARIWLLAYPRSGRHGLSEQTVFAGRGVPESCSRWPNEPALARVADGIPAGVDARRAIGNAVVPAIAEWIGGRIVSYEEAKR